MGKSVFVFLDYTFFLQKELREKQCLTRIQFYMDISSIFSAFYKFLKHQLVVVFDKIHLSKDSVYLLMKLQKKFYQLFYLSGLFHLFFPKIG